MPNSRTVQRFKDFEAVYRNKVAPTLAAVGLAPAAVVNAVVGAKTHKEKKDTGSNLRLVQDVEEPISEYVRRCNINADADTSDEVFVERPTPSVEKYSELRAQRLKDDRPIKPLIDLYEPIIIDVTHDIPIGATVVRKPVSYLARLYDHSAFALHANIIGNTPLCSFSKSELEPNFDEVSKRLHERVPEYGEVKRAKFYYLDTELTNPDDYELDTPSIYPDLTPFARESGIRHISSESHDGIDDIFYPIGYSYLHDGKRYLFQRGLLPRTYRVLYEEPAFLSGVSVPSDIERHLAERLVSHVPKESILDSSNPSIHDSKSHGRVDSCVLRHIFAEPDFLHCFNAYLFSSEVYLKLKRREPELADFMERPPQYPKMPDAHGLNLTPENIYDEYPTKVFTYNKPDGKRCAIAFVGTLGVERLQQLHTMLLAVDCCDYYEFW